MLVIVHVHYFHVCMSETHQSRGIKQ